MHQQFYGSRAACGYLLLYGVIFDQHVMFQVHKGAAQVIHQGCDLLIHNMPSDSNPGGDMTTTQGSFVSSRSLPRHV